MIPSIYKIVSRREWAVACEAGIYRGSADDRRDGYIHFSTRNQVRTTLKKHFTGRDELILLEVSPARLAPGALVYETSRKGEEFPHLYGDLPPSAVTAQYPVHLDSDQEHDVDF